jgi:uncharacterized protein YbjT (DUF2867 family)
MNKPQILVTGANGSLGSLVAEDLIRAGYSVTGLSRKDAPKAFKGNWRSCDLLDGEQVRHALEGVNVVVHCASNLQKPQDDGTVVDHLVAASMTRDFHIVYVSICGIEEASKHLEYYKVKIRNEEKLHSSGTSHTIVRISQFHPFVSMILSQLVRGPLILLPRFQLQPVGIHFAAQQLASHAITPPVNGRAPDVHGPDLLTSVALIDSWCKAQGTRKLRIPIPAFGLLNALASLTPASGVSGGISWIEWLKQEVKQSNPYIQKT